MLFERSFGMGNPAPRLAIECLFTNPNTIKLVDDIVLVRSHLEVFNDSCQPVGGSTVG